MKKETIKLNDYIIIEKRENGITTIKEYDEFLGETKQVNLNKDEIKKLKEIL